jgi:hypothetical protein
MPIVQQRFPLTSLIPINRDQLMSKIVCVASQLFAFTFWVVVMGAPGNSHAASGSWRALYQHAAPGRIDPIADRTSFSVEAISGQGGRLIPVFVTLPHDILDAVGSAQGPVFLLFRGIPSEVSFSLGFRIKRNWMVGVGDVGKLALLSDAGFAGSLRIQVALYLGRERAPLLSEVNIDLHAAPDVPEPPAPPAMTVTPVIVGTKAVAASPKRTSTATVEDVELLRRAETLLRAGDFESARLIYSEIASHGNAQAAVLMARTYDPAVLSNTFIAGMTADSQQARNWYMMAMELGETTAKQHFDRLAAQQAPTIETLRRLVNPPMDPRGVGP